ncbi:thiamine biosynthesis protein ThiC [Methanolacinia petrolearia DSM 11571]|uniref:Phosphomethylpyrimidine synthase n=1 Tax=Methanolacinia petrolearia (strain DSM 11571 / OCM 486 / SEBR 4847) TaxID=679926 RepID=E1RFU5_METP4|nr:phosphomethylpyrimidine synthase ThiC [Methanolacinia petrolearia]ADN35097.1 thiamine biosynthesis protein ThiC [Methanolacinia petrolearia DSM 11571]
MQTLARECKSGIPEIVRKTAESQNIEPERLARSIAAGKAVIPANRIREHKLCAIGEGCTVKVNVNIGTSGIRCDPGLEIEKAKCAISEGADAIMDLSTGGDLEEMRKKILDLDITVGTVPVYEAVRRAGSAPDLDSDTLFNVIRDHCKQGVDFLTLHCGVNRQALDALKKDPRVMGVVSRGGAFHIAMMTASGEENPLFAEYDYLVEMLAEYDVVISLGDGMRPGAMVDAVKRAKAVEYLTLGDLAQRAHEAGVQRMIEGPGHIPIDQIEYNVRMIKELTAGAPLYLLGPLVTDIVPGYDHVSGAIGGAIAAMNGADFLCMVSPSEHLALPSVEDIREGTRVAKLAAHVGDTIRPGINWFGTGEEEMAYARRDLDWKKQFSLAMFGEHAKQIHERDGETDTCSMCGDLCAVKIVRESLYKDS